MVMWVMSDRAHPAQLPHDGGLRRPHLPARQRRRAGRRFVQVPLEAAARRALAGVGRGAEDLRQGPGLPPPRPVGGDRGGRLPRVRARPADRRRGGRARLRLRPARSDQAHAGGARAGAPRRQADAQPQPGQLLRRDRAGRLLRRQRRARASTSPTIRCCRRGCSPTSTRSSRGSAARTSPRSRSTGRSRRCTTTSRTASGGTRSRRRARSTTRTASQADARVLAGAGAGASCTSPSASSGAKIRERSESFNDHFSQARMFLDSQSPPERAAPGRGLPLRARQGRAARRSASASSACFQQIDADFAARGRRAHRRLAAGSRGGRDASRAARAKRRTPPVKSSPALSLANQPEAVASGRARSRCWSLPGVSIADVDAISRRAVRSGRQGRGDRPPRSARCPRTKDRPVDAGKTFFTTASVLYDAVVVPGGAKRRRRSPELGEALHFVRESFPPRQADRRRRTRASRS